MTQRGLPKPPIHDQQFSYQWREWLRRAYIRVADAAQLLWDQIDKTGSNLTDIETRRHRDLQDLQGGTTDEYYHLTSTQNSAMPTLTDGSNADSLHTHLTGAAGTVDKILVTTVDALVTDGFGNMLIGDDV